VKNYDRTVYVEVQGHTDSTGSPEYNMMLGQKRADVVRRYLNEMAGIPLHLIQVVSYGEDSPVADNKTREGREANRRVVVRILE
jgi:outer membrane protein OmpA-like peptidoglycan-associated protein